MPAAFQHFAGHIGAVAAHLLGLEFTQATVAATTDGQRRNADAGLAQLLETGKGSAVSLFQECAQRYLATYAQVTECLWNLDLPPRQALEQALRQSARMQCEDGHPKGCMVGLAVMSAPSAELAQVTAPLNRSRARTRAGIADCVSRALDAGELRQDVDAQGLSVMFDSFLVGLSTLARDNIGIEAMERAITQVMRLWDSSVAV
ncbi:TetR/AcrR family transcriptional regulator [Pseudomonas sp. MH2]|uniref:TetR/AcrR family transcriptional regulator n=1 Tax=Pseudomonas machongensis TaxID=3110229 RepID=A0ABU5VLX5_9PSED|nr:TetR/AcrR family transcriptional regulator [Pseudomonas sp. MH2]MEA5674383.1 TetR/AcrR family transcriptional regulator [Pseudomonas sp. MH2]